METYHGHVRTPADAIILFEACRIGLLPRVQRRLSEKERQSIKSGSVFVWDEREAGMRRWTDGKSWSASRVSGSFLTYREMEGKRGGGSVSNSVARAGKTPDSTRGSDEDHGENGEEGPDGYRYKPDGLMKQSFSITTSTGQHLHLISYYARSHPTAPNLNQPSTDPALRHIRPQKGLYPESTVNDQQNLPVVTRGPMAGAAFSLSPHPMAAYPRSGATHPQSYTPPYAWPPTPLGTPPTVSIPYSASYLPPLSGAAGQLAYPQHPALPPPQAQAALPNPYDRSHPETTLPPPSQSSAAPNATLPAIAGRSPRASNGTLEAQQRNSPTYVAAAVDPRLMSPRSQAQQVPPNGEARRVPSPPVLRQIPPNQAHYAPANGAVKPLEPGTSGTVVPSIGALMNGAPAHTLPVSTAPPPSGPLDAFKGGLPAPGSRSPRTAPDGPKDIPSEKIGFGGEDMRALRQLDRVFTA